MARRTLALLVVSGLAVVVVSALVVGCGGHEPNRSAISAGKLAPTAPARAGGGRFVAISGRRRLYLECLGSGSPTVILEAGLPGTSDVWHDVEPQLARTTRVCAYDRAGLGRSPPMPGVHDAHDETRDLQRLVDGAHIEPPYVLVGHSYGGMLVRLFAHEHPDQTAGIVFVDARGTDATRRQLAVWPRSELAAVRSSVFARVQHGVDIASSEALASRVRSLGDTPLVVITAGRHDRDWGSVLPAQLARAFDRLWVTMQDELAALSSDHVHVVALNSDHFVQRLDGQPDVVIRAVRAVLRAARDRTQLPPCARLFAGPDIRCAN